MARIIACGISSFLYAEVTAGEVEIPPKLAILPIATQAILTLNTIAQASIAKKWITNQNITKMINSMGKVRLLKFNFRPKIAIIVIINTPANLSISLWSQNLETFPKIKPTTERIIKLNKNDKSKIFNEIITKTEVQSVKILFLKLFVSFHLLLVLIEGRLEFIPKALLKVSLFFMN